MSEAATTDLVAEEAILDELVPPPGPRWRRAVLWVAFLGLVETCTWATTTGTIIPKVITGASSWGGTGPVNISMFVINDSRVDIVVTDGPRARPGLSLIGYSTTLDTPNQAPPENPVDPFPLRLHPGEQADLTAWYRVMDCDAIHDISTDDNRIDIQVRIADGPAAWITTKRTIDAQSLLLPDGSYLSSDDTASVSWPAAVAGFACPA